MSHADLYSGLQATVGILAALLQRDAHRRRPARRRVDGRGDAAGHRVDRGRARRQTRSDRCTSSAASTCRCSASLTARRPRPGRPGVELPGVVRRDGPARVTDDERFATRERATPTATRCWTLFQEFAATFSQFDDFEAALGTGPSRRGTDASTARRRRRRVGPRPGRVGRRAVGSTQTASRCGCRVRRSGSRMRQWERTAGRRGRASTTARCSASCSR